MHLSGPVLLLIEGKKNNNNNVPFPVGDDATITPAYQA
jgi:hypothetical protein